MEKKGINITWLPEIKDALLIAGFDGWGNALDLSRAMVSYLIRTLEAECFATVNPDLYYRYDETRPIANIEQGTLKSISPPGGSFYAVRNRSDEKGLVILKANEPNLRWFHFTDELFSLCQKLGIHTIITLGSMYDKVLHTDRIISVITSEGDTCSKLKQWNVIPIDYHGPSAIHSLIHSEGQKKGFACVSLWCHCPYYLQGTTHFGLLSQLASLLSFLGGIEIDTKQLDASWKELNRNIQGLVEKNPELQAMINELRKAKVRGSWASLKESTKKGNKVISIKNFLNPGQHFQIDDF
jgi:proteasome assembly chaperone (PAC2) family protein